jgi:hypothetical protein
MGAGGMMRMAAIALAVVLAWSAAHAGHDAALPLALARLDGFIDGVLAPVQVHGVQPLLAAAAARGLPLALQPHAGEAVVLFLLLFLSLQNLVAGQGMTPTAARVLWSVVAALAAGFAAGTVPIDAPRLVWMVLAGIALWNAGLQLALPHAGSSAFAGVGATGLLLAMGQGLVPVHFMPALMPAPAGVTGTGLGLATLGLVLAAGGALAAARDAQAGLRAWLADRWTHEGLSILLVVAGAALALAI